MCFLDLKPLTEYEGCERSTLIVPTIFSKKKFSSMILWLKPVNKVTNGPKTFGRINEGFFTGKCMAAFARRPKKVAVIAR